MYWECLFSFSQHPPKIFPSEFPRQIVLDPLQKKIASELQMVYPVVQMEFTVKMDKNI